MSERRTETSPQHGYYRSSFGSIRSPDVRPRSDPNPQSNSVSTSSMSTMQDYDYGGNYNHVIIVIIIIINIIIIIESIFVLRLPRVHIGFRNGKRGFLFISLLNEQSKQSRTRSAISNCSVDVLLPLTSIRNCLLDHAQAGPYLFWFNDKSP